MLVNPSRTQTEVGRAGSPGTVSPAPSGNIINPGPDAVDSSPSQPSGPPIQNRADNVGGDSGNQPSGSGQHLATPPHGNQAGSSSSSSSTSKQKGKANDIRSIIERLQNAKKTG